MKTKIILMVMLVITGLMAFSQRTTIELTFTAENNGMHVQLDSIKVMNRTQGSDTVLYWPDTMLLALYYVGIPEMNKAAGVFKVFQNYPNPAVDQTTISLYVPEKDKVSMVVTDIIGRLILKTDRMLDKGLHSFRFIPGGANLHFFTAQWRGNSSSIKILQYTSVSSGAGSLEYMGNETASPQFKATEDIRGFSFNIGDELLYIGYAFVLQSGILDSPEESESYTFQFATNIPCPGTPTVEYSGQVYNTIQVFSQCWLKENLNVGTMIPGVQQMTNNWFIEKYCYNDEPDSCAKYGGLYQWSEMMYYSTQQGVKGICPTGWHIPTDEECKVLEGAVDSQYGFGDPEWDDSGIRGFDAGMNLKTTSGWSEGGNGTDLFGFSILPAGSRGSSGSFNLIGTYGHLRTSTEWGSSTAFYHGFSNQWPEVNRNFSNKEFGYPVRCLRDE